MKKRNKIYNKYYRNLRENVFSDLELSDFLEVFSKFQRLKMQFLLIIILRMLMRILFQLIIFKVDIMLVNSSLIAVIPKLAM